MNITLYVNSDDNRKLNKNLTSAYDVSAVIYDDCSIIRPVLKIKYFAGLASYNYLYIADYNRYYFINDITLSPANIAFIKCSCDVLMSFKNEILSTYQTITRYNDIQNVNVKNTDVTDTLLPVTKNYAISDLILFRNSAWDRFYNSGFDKDFCYILQTVGGGSDAN